MFKNFSNQVVNYSNLKQKHLFIYVGIFYMSISALHILYFLISI